jgi:hypothetical protein
VHSENDRIDLEDPRREALTYLDQIFGEQSGHLRFAFGVGGHFDTSGKFTHKRWQERIGYWPDCREQFLDEALRRAETDDVYLCPYLGSTPKREQGSALPSHVLYADDATTNDARLMLVDSGGGEDDSRHAYALTTEARESPDLMAGNRRLRAATGGDAKVSDNDVLRLPGTINHKTGNRVRLLQEGTPTPLEDLGLPPDPGGALEVASDADPSDDFDPKSLPFMIRAQLDDEPKTDENGKTFRSEQTAAFVYDCRTEGLSDANTVAAVLHHRPTLDRGKTRKAMIADARRLIGKADAALAEKERERELKTAETVDSFHAVSIIEFAAVVEPGAEPIIGIPGQIILPMGGDLIHHGPGGGGKSTIANDVAFHVAAGQDWLGMPVSQARRVLIVENEGPRPPLRERIGAKLKGWPLAPQGLSILEEPWGKVTLADADCRRALANLIGALETDLLVIGPLSRVGMDTAGTLQDVWKFQQLVQDVREQSGRSFGSYLVHHDNKAGTVSGAWEGATETDWHSPKLEGQGLSRLHVVKARWSTAWHGETLQLKWADDYGFELGEPRDLGAEIIGYLGGHLWKTAKEIREAVQADEAHVKRVLEEGIAATPPLFALRTGYRAKEVGRNANAKAYALHKDDR